MAGDVKTTPQINPSNYGTLVGMMKQCLDAFLQNVDDMLPARVISYDREKKVAQVQILIMIITADGTPVQRAPVAAVPVMQLGGGGYVLDFNLNPGDLGYIKACDRDISIFRQQFAESIPNTYRKHKFADAIFIPAPMTGYTIESGEEDACVLRTLDGTQRVVIFQDSVKIVSDNQITLDAPHVECTGTLYSAGNATITGTLHATVDVTAATISLVHHTHNGVQSGGSNTGQPNP